MVSLVKLINQGYLEIAFHLNNKLKLTELSKKVLFEGEKVRLANLAEFEKIQKIAEQQVKKVTATTLFDKLRELRLGLAKEAGIPAYQIFNDASLKEMEKSRPMSDEEFMQISGVGKVKMQNYGYQFIKAIIDFSSEKTKKTKKTNKNKGNSHKETLNLYAKGLSIEEIAQERKLAQSTIFSHIMKLYNDGEDIDLKQFINKEDINSVKEAKIVLDHPDTLKPYFEHFKQAMDYNTIKLALTVLENDK